MQPEKIGRYVILRTLGRGAMGVVYLARDPQIERDLALKTIRFDDAEKSFSAEEAKARFLKEAKISGRLQHPHIVTVFDVGEDGGMLYLAMELVQGGSFSQRLADPSGFAMRDRVRVVAEVADALAHAHERGVLHRDIKPANILLTPSLSAKVTDFGIGKLLTGDTELTSTGQMVGSPAYMSPEQIKGDKLDARTDIFSLGVVLYQAVTLRKPFPADTLTTLVYQILHEEPADPAVVAGDLPEGLGSIVSRCLAKDRANRYADAGELADDLREALGVPADGATASYSDSRVKRVRSSSSTPAAPQPAGSAASSMAPTAAMPIVGPGPVGAAPLPVTTPIEVPDSESPTITTGRRMGEVAARASGRVPRPAGKKGPSPAALGVAALVGVLAVAGGVYMARKGGPSDGKADAPPPPPETGSAPVAASGSTPSTAGPVVAIVETPPAAPALAASASVPAAPAPAASASVPAAPAAPKKARTKTAAGTDTAAPPSSAAVSAAKPSGSAAKPSGAAAKSADLTVTVRRFLKINVAPSQARVFLDGNYIGISDDWDDAGGGSLLTFNLEGQHRLRICYPEHRDLLVDVVVRATATDDKVSIDQELPKGTPDGPTGPEGSFHRPNYKTVGSVLFNVNPPDAVVSVNGKEYGPASKWAKDDMQFADMAVYQIGLAAPGYEPRTVRLMVAPTAGEVRATIKEKLKKQ